MGERLGKRSIGEREGKKKNLGGGGAGLGERTGG